MNLNLRFQVSELLTEMEVFYTINPLLLPQLNDKVKKVAVAIADLNAAVRYYHFTTVEDEIHFFKELKPPLVQAYIFMLELKGFYDKVADLEMQRAKPYKEEINRLLYFLKDEKEFYNYIKNNETYNDKRYFTRLAHGDTAYALYNLNADPESCSSHGFLLAKMNSYKQLVLLYNKQLNLLKTPLPAEQLKGKIPLVWKANKVDAVELVYALYYSGAVDTDKCSVQQLAQQFGRLFQIQITEQLYREFIDIKRRKIEPARFLVKLLNNFRSRLDDAYS
ncbi:RteC domain-containing protein [Flavobacterium sp. CBA20B-1]|uniref:RteC domain-containing protein n=1 Tax=unclassified Flavobacterium TaxID=196869 RepID=UPI0022254E46|nr:MULTISPECIES: RteC domain-containing protein [unclassified Flavobacterium]WCM42269.1 RteC domain-containing protein [Flavobacterium sp. CBA20B-1]